MSGRLGALGGAARAARDEAARLAEAIAQAQRAQEQNLATEAELQARLAELDPADADEDPGFDPGEEAAASKEELGQAATAARAAEMEARLEVRTVEERLRAIAGRADSLAAAAVAERKAATAAQARLEMRRRAGPVARAVAEGARFAVARIQASSAAADAERQHAGAGQQGPGRRAQGGPDPDPGAVRGARQGGEQRPRRRDGQAEPPACGWSRSRRGRSRSSASRPTR